MTQLDEIKIEIRNHFGDCRTVYVTVYNNSLAQRWLAAVNSALDQNLLLEKNYCFLGFAENHRNGSFILEKINESIDALKTGVPEYVISDRFSMDNVMSDDPVHGRSAGRNIIQSRLNQLHRYFEDLQGHSGALSEHYVRAAPEARWHIRQLNLLCHEFESWALSYRKQQEAPEWQRPSTLVCWLTAPRYTLEPEDLELFGIHTLNRPLGGVFVGVNKAVGKHHYEVFCDEGRDSRISELTTSAMRGQTEAAADFDIEWGQNPQGRPWQTQQLADFRAWLTANNIDPEDPALTIGHPQIAQVDLQRSFGTENLQEIWQCLNTYSDIYSISTGSHCAVYDYRWSDTDFAQRQIKVIGENK